LINKHDKKKTYRFFNNKTLLNGGRNFIIKKQFLLTIFAQINRKKYRSQMTAWVFRPQSNHIIKPPIGKNIISRIQSNFERTSRGDRRTSTIAIISRINMIRPPTLPPIDGP